MPDMPSITLVKRFFYRGADEDFSNKYHFSGTTPADGTAWKALADAIIAAEKLCYDAKVTWVKAYGYVAGNESSVAQIDYTAPPNTIVQGTMSTPATRVAPGDAAATIRWWTGESKNGKKIYCRKYMHSVWLDASLSDKLLGSQSALFATFAAKLIDGTLPGGFKYAGPQGATLSAPQVNQFLTTRTLKRRGKRPVPTP